MFIRDENGSLRVYNEARMWEYAIKLMGTNTIFHYAIGRFSHDKRRRISHVALYFPQGTDPKEVEDIRKKLASDFRAEQCQPYFPILENR